MAAVFAVAEAPVSVDTLVIPASFVPRVIVGRYGVARVELVQTFEGKSRCWSTAAKERSGLIEVVSPACPTSVL